MSSVLSYGTASLPLRLLEERSLSLSNSDGDPTDAVMFVGISLVLGIASRHVLRGTRVPYTVALLVLGAGLGALEYGTSRRLGRIGDGIRLWANIDPDLLLAVFLPALLFESSFSMEVHQIKRCVMQMFLLAGPGVLISTFCLGTAIKFALPFDWNWKTSLLLGGLLSATDPVAVVALLKELGASKKLSTIIEGESLMNDGTAIVVYQLFLQMVLGRSFTWGAVIGFLSQVSLGAIGLGLAFGIASVLWLGFIFNDTVIEISLTVAVSYIAYFTAAEEVDVSGVLTVMTLGMFYSAVARTAFKGESQRSLHHFWEMVAYIANTLIFILSGVVITESILRNNSVIRTHEHIWGLLFLLYLFVQVARVVVVGLLYPLLQYFGYGLDWKEATILTWAGLRGAVALALSLSVKRTSDDSPYISPDTGALFVFLTGGIVFLTLIVNGSTTQFLLHFLQMDRLSAAKKRILKYTKYEMLNKALETFGVLGEDEELGPAEWPTVKQYIASLNDMDDECMHPHSLSENNEDLDRMNLKDIRLRFLNGVQAAYWVMLDEGRITQTTANLLMQSVDEAIDRVAEALCDWRGLKSYASLPSHNRFLQSIIVPQKLVTYFTVSRLESACYICAAFLRAHRLARQQLRDFIGDSNVSAMVIRESEQEGEEARMFLEDVRVTFPQVLRVVKTRQVTYAVLNDLIDYVNNLEKIGLLEEKETIHLHDAVQTDMKKLLRNPPLVKVPKIGDLVASNPLLGALPSAVREKLVASPKDVMKLSGTMIYKEGAKQAGIWLLSNGVVKWSRKSGTNKHSLCPTFSHGTTLGLYEVLVGKPYICDIIADSVVLCFFVEAERIHSALSINPTVEDFFWRESTIVLAKILLPHMFEKMSMHDFRALIAERSTMNIYLRGETFELVHHSVGFLLEGFIKVEGGHEELLTAPAELLPRTNQSFHHSETSGARAGSFSSQVQSYQVESRSRVIIFDMAGFEPGRSLRRRSSRINMHSNEHLIGFLSREHTGLMSWPEQPFESRYHHGTQSTNVEENNLSTRAMQLSIYGSTLNIGKRARSFPRTPRVKPSHSLSHPSIPFSARPARPMVSVKSEGSTTMQHKFDVQQRSKQESNIVTVPPPARQDDSSDESGCEEHIVRIDTPSRLSFKE